MAALRSLDPEYKPGRSHSHQERATGPDEGSIPMHLVTDRPTQTVAIKTILELIRAGLAGIDAYDPDIFCVDAPQPLRDNADVALDILGATFLGAYGARQSVLQCRLPSWVRLELGLEDPDAPTLYMPLASRAVDLDQLIDQVSTGGVL